MPSASAATSALSPSPVAPPAEPVPSSPAPIPAPVAPAVPDRTLAGTVIVVDPGHNGGNAERVAEIGRGVDAGGFEKPCNTVGAATAAGYSEAAFTWDVAVRVRALLEAVGATVVLTRPDNDGWGPCVDERGRAAGKVGAAALLSIHADGSSAAGSGFHVIAPAARAGWTDATAESSLALAGSIRDALTTDGFTPANYIGADGLDVRSDLGTLNWAGTPAVIVECGNMRNAGDAEMLSSEDGRQRIAAALVGGLTDYLR
jgi:N-acetylmuramoyl-L-alanine amidase